jgi:RecA-family ATPase
LLDGDPGLGKSFLTLDVASRVSRGYQMPPDAGLSSVAPGAVLLLSGEDDPARTIRPRLDELGADLTRIFILTEIEDGTTMRPPVLPDDLAEIETLVGERGITLIIIDPVMAYLGGKVDAHKDSDVRKVLHAIKTLAERTQAAVVIVRHLNKMVSVDNAIYRGGGSIGIIGAARCALLVGKHPDNPEARVLCRTKGNLSLAPSALAYKIRSTDHAATVEWLGEVELSADDLLRRRPTDEAKQAEKDKSDDVLLLVALDQLDPDKHGVTVRKVRDRAEIGKNKLDRAMARLLRDEIIESIDLEVPVGTNGGTTPREGIRRKTPAPQAHIGTDSTRRTNLFEPT